MSAEQGSAPAPAEAAAPVEATAVVEDSDLDDGDDGDEGLDTPAEDTKALRKRILKLKMDDREIEHEVDFDDEEGLKRMFQKGLAADKRMSEAAEQRKQIEGMLEFMLANPEEALRHIGHDPEKLAEKIIERRLKELEMSPEEKARTEMQKKIEEYESELKRIQEEKEQSDRSAIEQKYAMEIDQKISKALDAHSDLPKSDYTVKRIVNELIKYTKAGMDVDVEDVVGVVKSKMDGELKELLRNMSDETYENWLGMENIGRIRKIRKAKMKAQPVRTAQSIQDESPKADAIKELKKKMNMRDFFKDPLAHLKDK